MTTENYKFRKKVLIAVLISAPWSQSSIWLKKLLKSYFISKSQCYQGPRVALASKCYCKNIKVKQMQDEQPSLTVQEGINSSGESLMHSLAPVAGLVVAQQSTADLKLHCPLKLLLIEWWSRVSFDYLFCFFWLKPCLGPCHAHARWKMERM